VDRRRGPSLPGLRRGAVRAQTYGHAVVLPCPQCARTWSTEQTLAGHLMDAHGMSPSAAVARAMQVAHEMMDKRHPKVGAASDGGDAHEPPEAPAAAEERAVSKQIHACSKCGSTGHNVLSPQCPGWGKPTMTAKACGYCKRTDHVYADCPTAKARRKGKKRMPTTRRELTPNRNGFAGALAALRVEREKLDAAITAVEWLEARGR